MGDHTVLLDTQHPAKDFELTRIRRSDGHVLAEFRHNKDTLEITLPGVKMGIDLVAEKHIDLSEDKKEKLAKFLQSSDATLLRQVIAEVIKQRTNEEQPSLYGFLVLAMLLGNEPASSNYLEPQAVLLNDLVQTHVSYQTQKHHRKPLLIKAFTKAPANKKITVGDELESTLLGTNRAAQNRDFGGPECNGSCGVGCTGIVYTNACLYHDNCVTDVGHAVCLIYLPAAVASLGRAIANGGVCDPADDWCRTAGAAVVVVSPVIHK